MATGVGRFGYLWETVIEFEIESGISEIASFYHKNTTETGKKRLWGTPVGRSYIRFS
jgi:hypothetical protein